MVYDSYFPFDDHDDDKIKYTFSRSSQENWEKWRHMYIERIIERIDLILNAHSTAHIWQAF